MVRKHCHNCHQARVACNQCVDKSVHRIRKGLHPHTTEQYTKHRWKTLKFIFTTIPFLHLFLILLSCRVSAFPMLEADIADPREKSYGGVSMSRCYHARYFMKPFRFSHNPLPQSVTTPPHLYIYYYCRRGKHIKLGCVLGIGAVVRAIAGRALGAHHCQYACCWIDFQSM